MTPEEIKKIVKMCRKEGILELEMAGLKIKLGPKVTKHKTGDSDVPDTPQYTEEDILNWNLPRV